MTIRDTRLQAAVLRHRNLLLVRCALPDGRAFWLLPGGGREPGESDVVAVAREVREEMGIEVDVGPVLYDVPADAPDGIYMRWRTFKCRILRGEPMPGGGDGYAELTNVCWLPLDKEDQWEAALRRGPFLYPQLLRIRAASRGTLVRGGPRGGLRPREGARHGN